MNEPGASDAVRYELVDGVGVITIDDGRVNAFGYDTVRALETSFARAEAEAVAVVIAGRPGILSAGFDLAEVRRSMAHARKIIAHGGAFFVQVLSCPKPVVIACTGHAVAGGAVLLMVGDVRIGSHGNFRIGLNEVDIGIPLPDFVIKVGQYRFDRRLCERALLGEMFGPDGAVELGLLDRVVPEMQVIEVAVATARKLAARSPAAYAATKTAARAEVVTADWTVPESVDDLELVTDE